MLTRARADTPEPNALTILGKWATLKKFAAIRRLGGFRLEPIISSLIGAAESGDAAATNALFSALYTELHRLAKRELARRGTGKPECNHASARGAFQWIKWRSHAGCGFNLSTVCLL